MTGGRTIAIAAGGTGGHMYPAHAFAREMQGRGYRMLLITDARGRAHADMFADTPITEIPAASPSRGRGLFSKLRVLKQVMEGRSAAKAVLRRHEPRFLMGFGGYPALPAVLAAKALKIPYGIHEQNAVLGRVNRLVARRAEVVALSFEDTQKLTHGARQHLSITGNPVRPEISVIREAPYPRPKQDSIFRLLVVGGSQGARILSDVVPAALSLLPKAQRDRLQVTQQCRPEDIDRVNSSYRDSAVAAQAMTYIDDLPERLMWAHLVISRAGASTVAELTAAGRPSILVPLASATDDHQTANVRGLAEKGGAWAVPEAEFTAAELAKLMRKLVKDSDRLATMAKAARALGRPRASADLADLVEPWVKKLTLEPIAGGLGGKTGPAPLAEERVML